MNVFQSSHLTALLRYKCHLWAASHTFPVFRKDNLNTSIEVFASCYHCYTTIMVCKIFKALFLLSQDRGLNVTASSLTQVLPIVTSLSGKKQHYSFLPLNNCILQFWLSLAASRVFKLSSKRRNWHVARSGSGFRKLHKPRLARRGFAL